MSSSTIKYAVISPVRNEERFLPLTINSMVAQAVRPARWVIVNDGSTDNTRAIAEAAAASYPWIKVVNRADRGFRKAGGGVIEAFYDGFKLIDGEAWDYIVKLDGDLSFDADYFARCFQEFSREERLGIGGGTICDLVNGSLRPEFKNDPKFHVRGATKIYRWSCWRDIGGLLKAPGWDTLDEVKANMVGWTTSTFSEIKLVQHRPTGAAYGTWNDRVKGGMANYIAGYHPLFMLVKSIKRMAEPPYLVGGLGLMFGFTKGYLKRVPQVDDKVLLQYFRQQQMNRLLFRSSLWK